MMSRTITFKRRWVWIPLGVVAAVVAGLPLAGYALHERFCLDESLVYPSVGGDYDVVVVTEDCDAFGSDVNVSVKLRRKGLWNLETEILDYEPVCDVGNFGNPPDIRWVGQKELRVSVNAVAQIHKKITASHGIRIAYEVGRASYPMSSDSSD